MVLKKCYDETPVLTAKAFHSYDERFPKTVIVTWRKDFIDSAKRINNLKYNEIIYAGGAKIEIYLPNPYVSMVCLPIGGPATAYCIECLKEMGAEKFIYIGSCGELSDTGDCQFIVPTKAYRGEGTSQYYTRSRKNHFDVPNYQIVENYLKSKKYTFVEGSTYSTDGLFRETPTFIKKVKKLGCNCIDMESSAIMAISKQLDIQPYQLFFKADSFVKDYKSGGLSDNDTSIDYDKLLKISIGLSKYIIFQKSLRNE